MGKETPTEQVISRIHGHGRDYVFTPADFSDIAKSATIKKALSRLTERKRIRRLLRGVYDNPAYSERLNELAPPNPDHIAQAIARTHGWTIVPGGETALNLLGLSTQVPASWEYLSDGPYRNYEWLGNTMNFKHRTNKETTILSPKTALIVQALKSLGKNYLNNKVISTLANHIEEKEKKKILKEAKFVTDWIYEIIREICQPGEFPNA